jgi:hypothetical protein
VNFDQFKTILWLRWHLSRNQWRRSGGIGAVIAALVAVAIFVLSGLSFLGGLLGGMLGLGQAKPGVVLGVWFGVTVVFLFMWMIGLLSELQRSESIDLQRLMHLPVALGQMFVINYAVSHLTLSIIIAVPAMLGLAVGLVLSRGPAMLLLVPLALSMVFMVTAWTYCLRGWLATLMANPRRRRTVIMVITIAFVLVGQGPNLYFNVIRQTGRHSPASASEGAKNRRAAQKANDRESLNRLLALQKFIPPLWLPVGAKALAEGRALPALFGTFGCLVIGALGLRQAYHSTMRFYHGETGKKSAIQVKPRQVQTGATNPAKTGSRFLELRLPGVPEQAAALALASFRSMLRAPEVKMAWGSAFLPMLIVGGTLMVRTAPHIPEAAKPFIVAGAVVFSVFMLVQFFANQFGFDRDGFRVLILSPAQRRLILLGKNLACLPVGVGSGVVSLTLISVWMRLSPVAFVAGLAQLVTLLLLASLAGNFLSIFVPYRIQPGSMKPTKMPGLAMAVMILFHLLFPAVMLPVFVPPLAQLLWQAAGWPDAVPVNLLLSLLLALAIGFLYWHALDPLGRLLQRRETKILSVVTVEVE